MKRGPFWGYALLLGLSLLLAVVLAFDGVPFLRGGFGWQWPYEPVPLVRALPLAVALAIYLAGAWGLLRRSEKTAPLLIWSMIGVVALTVAALWLRADDALYELFVRTASGVTTGQHFAGAEIDWSDPNWVNWPVTVQPFVGRSGHIVLSGPLLPMIYGLLNAILEKVPSLAAPLQRALVPYQCRNYDLLAYTPAQWASAWFGMAMPLWAALGVIPLYGLARRLLSASQVRLAVAWWPLIPALILFAPTWNTLYPLAALVAFWLLLRGLEDHPLALIASGLVTGLLTFANFSMLPLLGLLGFYALLHNRWLRRRGWLHPVVVGLWFLLGLLVPWLIFGLASGLTPLDLFQHAMANHLILERPYLPWLWLHFWEWALLAGIPMIVLWLIQALRLRREAPGGVLALALLLTMAVLIFSGTARGETGRVWLFFAPFVLITAAGSVSGEDHKGWLAVGLGQAALLLAVGATWMLINAPNMSLPPQSPGPTDTNRAADANFDGDFRLVGWEAQVREGTLELRLNWQPLRPVTTPYWLAALLVAPDGGLPVDSVVWQPLDTEYPTTCWQPGEIVGDGVELPLPADAASGDWWISLSAFADKDHPALRLPVTLPDGTPDDQVGLGPVTIP